jgi:hypothetical protein
MTVALPSSIASKDSAGPFALAAGIDPNGNKFQGVSLLDAGGAPVVPAGQSYLPVQDAALAVALATAQTTNLAMATSLLTIAENTVPSGEGGFSDLPSPTANGAPLGTPPAGVKGVRIYLKPGSSVSYTKSTTAPPTAPAHVCTVSNPAGNAAGDINIDENLNGAMLYITAVSNSGSAPFFAWF